MSTLPAAIFSYSYIDSNPAPDGVYSSVPNTLCYEDDDEWFIEFPAGTFAPSATIHISIDRFGHPNPFIELESSTFVITAFEVDGDGRMVLEIPLDDGIFRYSIWEVLSVVPEGSS